MVVGHPGGDRVERDTGDGGAAVADRAQHQRGVDDLRLAAVPLDSQALDAALTEELDRGDPYRSSLSMTMSMPSMVVRARNSATEKGYNTG
ncbi:hypothetical protein ABZ518_24625 [Rhodococcus sp. NPDC019616]|uniref:hypothetical protein n=1 Tax=Rhodococcus sp. NPDC019616 TaxID=3154691 RepID=UPI0033BFEF49